MKFDSHIGSTAAEVPVKFQSDRTILNTNLEGDIVLDDSECLPSDEAPPTGIGYITRNGGVSEIENAVMCDLDSVDDDKIQFSDNTDPVQPVRDSSWSQPRPDKAPHFRPAFPANDPDGDVDENEPGRPGGKLTNARDGRRTRAYISRGS